jgi:hypothetical protein
MKTITIQITPEDAEALRITLLQPSNRRARVLHDDVLARILRAYITQSTPSTRSTKSIRRRL